MADAYATDVVARVAPARVGWGAVFAGLVVAVSLQILLTVLGAAIGVTALDATDGSRAVGIGAAIWALLIPLITLFVGGMVAGRFSPIYSKGDAVLRGVLVWGMSILLAAYLVGTGASRVIGGAFSMVGDLGSGAVSAAGAVAGQTSEEQIRNEAQQRGITEADLRREMEQARQQASEVAGTAQEGAEMGLWVALGALLLSLGAAVFGAGMGPKSRDPAVVATT